MPDFLSICKDVTVDAGIQITLDSVESAQGIHQKITSAVRDSWIYIQLLREGHCRFMEGRCQFLASPLVSLYTPSLMQDADIVAGLIKGPNIGEILPGSLYLDGKPLRYVEPDQFFLKSYGTSVFPLYYTIDPVTQAITLSPFTAEAQLKLLFWKSPQILTESSDVPLIPTKFHNTIKQKGLEIFATRIGDNALYTESKVLSDVYLGKLLRIYNPHKKFDLNKRVFT